MTLPQTSVSSAETVGIPGLIADMGPNNDVRSYVNEESSAEIPDGIFVKAGTAEDQCKLPVTGTTSIHFLGVTVLQQAAAKPYVKGDTGIKPKNMVPVLDKGTIWVRCETAMAITDDVFVRVVAEGEEVAGAVRNDIDSDCINISGWARVVKAASGAGVCQIKLDVTMRKEKAGD